jgi:hypothetical protein
LCRTTASSRTPRGSSSKPFTPEPQRDPSARLSRPGRSAPGDNRTRSRPPWSPGRMGRGAGPGTRDAGGSGRAAPSRTAATTCSSEVVPRHQGSHGSRRPRRNLASRRMPAEIR